MRGIEHLRQAAVELNSTAGNARNRLRLAGGAYRLALFDSASWSPEIQAQSYSVTSKLLAKGSVEKTVLRMRNDAIRKTTTLLGAFCLSAERCEQGSLPGDIPADFRSV